MVRLMQNGTPHLIKDGGIYVENATGKDYSGTAMYAQAGIDKAFHAVVINLILLSLA